MVNGGVYIFDEKIVDMIQPAHIEDNTTDLPFIRDPNSIINLDERMILN
jgi:hypothetical protein